MILKDTEQKMLNKKSLRDGLHSNMSHSDARYRHSKKTVNPENFKTVVGNKCHYGHILNLIESYNKYLI